MRVPPRMLRVEPFRRLRDLRVRCDPRHSGQLDRWYETDGDRENLTVDSRLVRRALQRPIVLPPQHARPGRVTRLLDMEAMRIGTERARRSPRDHVVIEAA